jgi:hypothetical protein
MPGEWINIHMKKILVQYLWLFSITLILLVSFIGIQGCTFTHISSEEKQIQKEWEAIDKEREKQNDSN